MGDSGRHQWIVVKLASFIFQELTYFTKKEILQYVSLSFFWDAAVDNGPVQFLLPRGSDVLPALPVKYHCRNTKWKASTLPFLWKFGKRARGRSNRAVGPLLTRPRNALPTHSLPVCWYRDLVFLLPSRPRLHSANMNTCAQWQMCCQ